MTYLDIFFKTSLLQTKLIDFYQLNTITMITRMTITGEKTTSREFNKHKPLPREEQLRKIVDEAKQTAIFYFNCSTLFQYLLDNPDADIKDAYKMNFTGGDKVTVRNVSKKERTYNFSGCVVTEVDTNL